MPGIIEFPYTDEQLFQLSGVAGLYEDDEPDNVTIYKQQGSDYIRLRITCSYIDLLDIELLYNVNLIFIHTLISSGKEKGIAGRCIKAQEYYAALAGYKQISLRAHRDDSQVIKLNNGTECRWNGYYTWGKLGFLFVTPKQYNDFLSLMKKHNRSEERLHLLLKDKTGSKIWLDEGFSWFGKFTLEENSESHNILKEIG